MVERFLPLAFANAAASRGGESGCRQFDVLVDPDRPERLLYYEVYDSAAAFEAHQQTAHFKHYVEHAVPMLAQRERTIWRREAP
jgi:quinol monooxygenase YgiN